MKKTKYQQIINHLTRQIELGELKKGDKIPSVRKLAQSYQCNKDTVQKALLELRYQKYIYAVPKSGYYVLEQAKTDSSDLELPLTDDRHQAYEDFRLCVNETLIGRENYLFNYYSQQEGLPELRQSVKKLLLDSAIYPALEDIVLTSGTQQALYILSQIDFPNHKKTILIEQPTYHRMNDLVRSQNLPYKTITRNPQGINLQELEQIFKSGDIKFIYTIPRFHYPLGHTYSRIEKEEILRLAKLYNVFIIEDDYLADLDSKQELSFHYLDDTDSVIYIRAFSTSLFSALRITALLLPSSIKENFIAYKNILDYDSNLIMQKALSLYIDNQMFQKNKLALLRLKEHEKEKAQLLLKKAELDFQYQLTADGVLFDIQKSKSIGSLKHSKLPLDFFESAYINTCPYQYTKIKYDDLESNIEKLKDYFKKA